MAELLPAFPERDFPMELIFGGGRAEGEEAVRPPSVLMLLGCCSTRNPDSDPGDCPRGACDEDEDVEVRIFSRLGSFTKRSAGESRSVCRSAKSFRSLSLSNDP